MSDLEKLLLFLAHDEDHKGCLETWREFLERCTDKILKHGMGYFPEADQGRISYFCEEWKQYVSQWPECCLELKRAVETFIDMVQVLRQ
jgi:hypothetical protein